MLVGILILLLDVAFGFITMLLLARFFMQWQRVSFRNQIGQFVVTTTDWVVRPLRRAIPGLFGLDMASLLPAWAFQTVYVSLEFALRGAPFDGGPAAVLLGVWGMGLVALLRMAVYLVMAVVLVSAVMSWVNPHAPAASVFQGLAAPFLRPFRRIVPMVANVDLSPLVLLVLLQIVLIVLADVQRRFVPLLSASAF